MIKNKMGYLVLFGLVALFFSLTMFFKKDNVHERLLEAARQGLVTVAQDCINRGADVAIKDKTGWTPLHYAAGLGHQKIVAILLDHGAQVNANNKIGLTPLQLAKGGGHKEIETMLVKCGAKQEALHLSEGTRELQAHLDSGYKEMLEAFAEQDQVGTTKT